MSVDGARARAPTFLLLVLAACGGEVATVSSEPTPAVRPADPDGWVTITSPDGSVTLVVPPDFVPIAMQSGLFLQVPTGDPANPVSIQVTALGPTDAEPQPRGGEPLRRWLEAGAMIPSASSGGVTATGDESEGEVQLPAGRAYRVAITANPGTPEAGRTIAYAVATERGFAVLQIVGHPDALAARAEDLALLAALMAVPGE